MDKNDNIFNSLPDINGSVDVEQLVSLIKDMASVMAAYYIELIKLGVAPEHAVLLTISYQDSMIRMSRRPPEE